MRKHTRTRWILLTVILIALIAVLAACGGDEDEENNTDDVEPTATTETLDMDNTDTDDSDMAAISMDVSMVDNAFEPQDITVAAGTTVVWTNNGENPHTVTSGTRDAQTDTFDSGNIEPGGTFEYTFDEPGTYDYFCSLHEGMDGTVTVTGE